MVMINSQIPGDALPIEFCTLLVGSACQRIAARRLAMPRMGWLKSSRPLRIRSVSSAYFNSMSAASNVVLMRV